MARKSLIVKAKRNQNLVHEDTIVVLTVVDLMDI